MRADIIPIAKVRAHSRCPNCGLKTLIRSSTPHEGLPLYDLVESCTVCGHEEVTENVKVG